MRSFLVFLILTAAPGFADTLYKKDGRIVSGTYLGGTSRLVKMDVGDRVESYDVSDVLKIEFQSATSAAQPSSRDVRQTEVEYQSPTRLIRPDSSLLPTPPPHPPP